MKLLLIFLVLSIPINTNAAAIAISLNCKAISYIICKKRCQVLDQKLPRLLIDVGNSKIERKTDKTLKLSITNIQKIEETHSTLMSYKTVKKNQDKSTIEGFINIDKFFPGKALNDGIRESIGNYIVCLSAHCIPEDDQWLSNLLKNIKDNPKIAGVYGRQLPLSFTESIDKRDLLIVFGLDRRVQEKDYFFHNANSMIPRKVWDKFPFDEEVTNIEDRIWGKEVIEAGYKIIYEPGSCTVEGC